MIGPNPIILFTKWVQLHEVCDDKMDAHPIGAGILFIASTPRNRFHATTFRFDHVRRPPAVKGTGQCSLLAECGHRWSESRQGGLKHHTSQGCFWLRRHPAHNDQGMLSCLPRRDLQLTHDQDTMANEQDYVELGLSCADICRALDRGMNGKTLNDLSKSVCDAINQLTT